jgi:ATP-dependent DNA helicase RecG
MLRTELLEIIANGESSGVEFKRDDIRPETLAKEIVAMANLRGGMVLLGVEDDGTVSGVQRDDLETWVMDTIFGRYVHPMLLPFYEVVTLDGDRRVAVVSIAMGNSKPYVLRHNGREDIYVRVGSTSRLATREQQARLFESGGMLHSEALPVSGAGLQAMDRERLTDYLVTLVGDAGPPTTDDGWLGRMVGLGFMTEETGTAPVCTIAGWVLFGRTPRRYLRQAGVRWMAFNGADRNYQALDDTIVDGPLVGHFEHDNGAHELIERGLIEDLMDRMQPIVATEDEELAIRSEAPSPADQAGMMPRFVKHPQRKSTCQIGTTLTPSGPHLRPPRSSDRSWDCSEGSSH